MKTYLEQLEQLEQLERLPENQSHLCCSRRTRWKLPSLLH